jgi:hypothetical protein
MFYSAMAAPTGSGTIQIGRATATVANPYSWTEYSSNPILSRSGQSTRLDSMQYVGGTWYMYVSGGGDNSIDLYTSTDGFTFTASSSNPVLSPSGQGCSDGNTVSQSAVLKDGSTWRMYYSYRTSTTTLAGLRYATSSDGITWSKTGGSSCSDILSIGNAQGPSIFIEWTQILKIGSNYILTTGGYNGSNWATYLAYSTNPASGWTWSLANPIFGPSGVSGSWDSNHESTAAFYQIGSIWYLYYQGTNAAPGGTNYAYGHWAMGVATLAAGINPSSAIP